MAPAHRSSCRLSFLTIRSVFQQQDAPLSSVFKGHWAARATGFVLLGAACLGLMGCQYCAKSPLGKEPSREDFQRMTTPAEILGPARPRAAPKAAQAALPAVYRTPLSVHLAQGVSLASALEQMAACLKLDVQMPPSLRERKLTFSASNKPFVAVLERLCALAELRYRVKEGGLVLEPDTPFSRSYNVQFLNLTRSSENRISSGTDIFSATPGLESGEGSVVGGKAGAGENGSKTSVNMKSQNDFWKEVEVNLQTLLSREEGAAAGPAGSSAEGGAQAASFSVHRQAGVISVWGNSEQHYRVKEYLDLLRKAVSSQILIEAKVVEVDLREDFKSGIDWGLLRAASAPKGDDFFGGRNFTQALEETTAEPIEGLGVGSGFIQYTAQFSGGLTAILKTLNRFGSTRTLSSPRLTVMNNQSAVLKVARNHVYFRLNYNKHFYTKSDHEDINVGSDIQTVPIGLVMAVQPAIDPVNKSVILFLRPTISRLVSSVKDPSVTLASQQRGGKGGGRGAAMPVSEVPVIEVKEIDSVLRLKDGEVAVLGGLMETHSAQDRLKNPLLGEVPVVKEAFSSVKKSDSVTEVVILIRVKILDSVAPDEADCRLIHLYTSDPRPVV